MALTYQAIATVTVGSGGAANIDFQNIPNTFTDLQILLSGRGDQTTYNYEPLYVRLNNDTTNANYTQGYLFAEGTSVYSSSYNDGRQSWMNSNKMTASTFANVSIYIPNYLSSNAKSSSGESVIEGNQATTMLGMYANLWSGTAAITRITLVPLAGNFVQYSTATLYGIKATV